MEDFDVNQSGFFHLTSEIMDFINQTGEAAKLIDYEIEKTQSYIKWAEKNLDTTPEKQAMMGESFILQYLSPKICGEIRSNELDEICKASESINAKSDVLYLYEKMASTNPNTARQIKQLKEEIKTMLSNKEQISLAQAMCERGYFCQRQFEKGIRSKVLVQKGLTLMETGISMGGKLGMPTSELLVWKYYLVDLYRQLFELQASDFQNEQELLQIAPYFHHMAKQYHDLIESSDKTPNFYTCRAAIHILLTMQSNQRITEKVLQQSIPIQSETLRDMYREKSSVINKLLQKSTNDDCNIPCSIAQLHFIAEEFEEALKYADLSLEMENYDVLAALNVKLGAYAKLAGAMTDSSNGQDHKYMELAYDVGKRIQKIYATQSSAYFMSRVCYRLAVDASTGPTHAPKLGYLEDAIRFAVMGIQTRDGGQHSGLHRVMSNCLWLKDCFLDSIVYLRKALHFESQANFLDTLSVLFTKYRFILENQTLNECFKQQLLKFLANDIEAEWEKINPQNSEQLLEFTLDVLRYNNLYIKDILLKLEGRNTFKARNVHKEYCELLKAYEGSPQWLKDYSTTTVVS